MDESKTISPPHQKTKSQQLAKIHSLFLFLSLTITLYLHLLLASSLSLPIISPLFFSLYPTADPFFSSSLTLLCNPSFFTSLELPIFPLSLSLSCFPPSALNCWKVSFQYQKQRETENQFTASQAKPRQASEQQKAIWSFHHLQLRVKWSSKVLPFCQEANSRSHNYLALISLDFSQFRKTFISLFCCCCWFLLIWAPAL